MPATIQEIGKALNLSHTTVSRVLNGRHGPFVSEATRERIEDAARTMGYRPHRAARALATGRTHQVALWMRNVTTAYHAQVIRGLLEQIRQSHYQVMIGTSELSPKPTGAHAGFTGVSSLDDILGNVDGCIVFEAMRDLPVQNVGDSHRRPLVGMGGFHFTDAMESDTDFVGVDLYAGSQEALKHLLEIGCRRIALVSPHPVWPGEPRNRAYAEAMEGVGCPLEIIPTTDLTRATAREKLREYIVSHGCPDGLFCFNDDVALGAYRAARDLGLRIPEDMALIGHDGIEDTEYLDCPLTTLIQPVEAMCATAWQFLLRRMADPSLPPQQTFLQSKLLIRASTGRREASDDQTGEATRSACHD